MAMFCPNIHNKEEDPVSLHGILRSADSPEHKHIEYVVIRKENKNINQTSNRMASEIKDIPLDSSVTVKTKGGQVRSS